MATRRHARKRGTLGSDNRSKPPKAHSRLPAVLFDLDGTLIDSVYEHVVVWSKALKDAGIVLPSWKIHRHVGMSGKSFLRELLREMKPAARQLDLDRLEQKHLAHFIKRIDHFEPLPGSRELLKHLSRRGVPWAIATTGSRAQTKRLLQELEIPNDVPVISGDDVENAKPSPDVFILAAERLRVPISDCIVVGDSVWDLLAAGRKNALGVGLLSGEPELFSFLPILPRCCYELNSWGSPARSVRINRPEYRLNITKDQVRSDFRVRPVSLCIAWDLCRGASAGIWCRGEIVLR